MKQDLSLYYADDGAGANEAANGQDNKQDLTQQSSGGGFWNSLFSNLGGILTGAGNLATGINTKNSTTTVRESKTLTFNNGTTIAAIIGAAVVLTVVVVMLMRKD